MSQSADALTDAKYAWARRHTYVALDVPSWLDAQDLIRRLGPGVDGYKVGMELFYAEGTALLTRLAQMGKRVFLDVKLHDIPNTVARALKVICKFPVEMVNVHVSGGEDMLRAAREAVADSPFQPLLIGVTVLTSLDAQACASIGWPPPAETVTRLADLAVRTGLDGVVTSAAELAMLAAQVPEHFERVVPGIRPDGASLDDQRRTMSPGEAVAQGATRLVLGRVVTRAADPAAALRAVWDEMLTAKAHKEEKS